MYRRSAASWYGAASRAATGISASGSSVSETRIVSPRPSSSSEPMPTALLIRPSSPLPASVTPRWSGNVIPISSIRATSRRYAWIITFGLDAFIERMTSG